MYYMLIFTFAVCCASSVYEVEFVEHLHQEHQIRMRETVTTPPTKTVTDNHDYYTSKVVSDPDGMYWNELEGHTRHNISNNQHFKYTNISLSFKFPFYGHLIDTFDITTGGFLYMGSFHHHDVYYPYSRYIAPLMANFDTNGNDSDILYRDDGDSCVIEWRNVQLNDQRENGNYTFQTTLFENGTILFSYKSIPETNISESIWYVRVGIADSYYYYIGDRRRIRRYHTIQKNVTDLTDNMAIILDPLPTCNTASSCTDCTELKSGFNCAWCPSISRCSDGIDRHRQEWIDAGCRCKFKAVNSSDMCTTSTTTSATTTAILPTIVTTTHPTLTTTENTVTDNHDYYTSKVVSDPDGMYWNELEGHTRHNISNDQHFIYTDISLSFNFMFYGHSIDTFDITTGGFLYMGSFHHHDVDYPYSRYIAPLMANFDINGSDSDILYRDDGDSCVIEWRNVQLNDQRENGNYTFQTTLFENGTILFSYKSIPETNISDRILSVKVGIADSYYYYIGDRRRIRRYHTIQKDVTDLTDNMAIILDPLPTCNTASSCTDCTELKSGFNCAWCPSISRCSDGIDRHRQEWIDAGCRCKFKAVNSSDMCTTSTTTSATTTAILPTIVTTTENTEQSKKGQAKQEDSSKTLLIVIPIVVVCSVLLILVGVWVVYARGHPDTSSGRWLIENRPSRIKKKISVSFSTIGFSRDSETGDKAQIS